MIIRGHDSKHDIHDKVNIKSHFQRRIVKNEHGQYLLKIRETL